jgi:hypothetical protein
MIEDQVLVLDSNNNIVVETPNLNCSNDSGRLDNKRMNKEGVKEADISWVLNKAANHLKESKDLDKEYEAIFGLKKKKVKENLKVPVKNKKELIKEKEDKKLYGTINSVSIEQERIEKLKKIDNLIKEESEIEEEDLVNNRFENLSLNKEVDTRVNNPPCILSTVINEYIDSESRNNSLASRNKIAELEKEKYFEENKNEFLLNIKIYMKK